MSYRTSVHDFSRDLDNDGSALLDAVGEQGLAALRGSASTAHISAVDDDGTACAITMSSGYGAGLSIPGTGILLNNAWARPSSPARPARHPARHPPGLQHGTDHRQRRAGRALAIGCPGADRIDRTDVVLGKAACTTSTSSRRSREPRLHLRPARTATPRSTSATPDLAAAIEASGLPGHEYPEPHMYFGGVGAAQRRPGRPARGRRRRPSRGRDGNLRLTPTSSALYSTITLTRR